MQARLMTWCHILRVTPVFRGGTNKKIEGGPQTEGLKLHLSLYIFMGVNI